MIRSRIIIPVLCMILVIVASNILVQYPFKPLGLHDLLTWGAFTYPVAFFITDITNRRYGPQKARWIVFAGFIVAVFLSIWFATPRIA
ncbi:MAG: queuosine precursor transporter, partial [Rhodobiaceae bacterium]|nr:queuosine precursor transporter [Rhodobiaceae bacterium]